MRSAGVKPVFFLFRGFVVLFLHGFGAGMLMLPDRPKIQLWMRLSVIFEFVVVRQLEVFGV